MIITIPGYSTLSGRPETIVRLMQEAQFFNQIKGPEEYIKHMQQTAWRMFGIGITVEGDTIAERCESLLQEMSNHGMITITEK